MDSVRVFQSNVEQSESPNRLRAGAQERKLEGRPCLGPTKPLLKFAPPEMSVPKVVRASAGKGSAAEFGDSYPYRFNDVPTPTSPASASRRKLDFTHLLLLLA